MGLCRQQSMAETHRQNPKHAYMRLKHYTLVIFIEFQPYARAPHAIWNTVKICVKTSYMQSACQSTSHHTFLDNTCPTDAVDASGSSWQAWVKRMPWMYMQGALRDAIVHKNDTLNSLPWLSLVENINLIWYDYDNAFWARTHINHKRIPVTWAGVPSQSHHGFPPTAAVFIWPDVKTSVLCW